jgi:WD40 repeat protein
MKDSLRASEQGLEIVDQARQQKGWNRQSFGWAKTAKTSVGTLKRFWRREPIGRDAFEQICQAVGVDNWQEIVDNEPTPLTITDWGEAPELSFFCGRTSELETLEQWVVGESSGKEQHQRCKLIALLGMGGMGKTTLAVRLADRVLQQFEFFVWRSLRDAPPPETLFFNLIQFFSNPQQCNPPESLSEQLGELMTYLREHRCLVVLDNVESILADGNSSAAGCYRSGYERYGELFRRVGEERHQSLVVITSREQPREVALLEGEKVRSLRLEGLSQEEGQKILEETAAISDKSADSRLIVEHYAGNPLALKIVAAGIRDVFYGKVNDFLEPLRQGNYVFGDIQDLLERHFERLSNLEQEVMYWLAIAREPVEFEELRADLLSPESRLKLAETLNWLQRRSLLEIIPTHSVEYTLQPAVMEYVTNRLIEKIYGEIVTRSFTLFKQHALLKATAKDYILQAQTCLILEPLILRLWEIYDSTEDIKTALVQILPTLRGKPAIKTGYVGGNILNLLYQLQVNLSGCDFSHLTIKQAYLRCASLHQVNFAHSDFWRCVFTETFSSVLSVAFSPDGKTLAKGDDRGWISVWQVETGEQLFSFQAHSSWVFSVAFSPDGQTLASGGLDRTVKLWDWKATGQCLQTLQMHSGEISAVAFSPISTPSSRIIASSSTDQAIKLTNLQTGECLNTLTGHRGIVRRVAFSRDGQTLASASLDCTIKVWDTNTGDCLKTLEDTAAVYAVAFVTPPDSQTPAMLASGGEDGRVKLWDITTGQCLRTLEGHGDLHHVHAASSQENSGGNRVWSLVVSPDGETLISSSDDKTVKLWNLQTGQCLKTLPGHQSRIWSVALSPDGETLASGSDDKTVRLWNLSNGQCLRTLQGYHNDTHPVVFATPSSVAIPQGLENCLEHSILLTFSADQKLRFWDTNTAQCLKTVPLATKAALQAALSPDGKTIATGSLDYTIRLCDVRSGDCLMSLQGHTTWVRFVTFSPDGAVLASASGDQTIKLWDVVTGECLKTLMGHTNPVQCVVFHPEGKILASGSWDQTVKIWDADSGACLLTLEGHSDRIGSIVFSPDGQTLISSSQDQTIRFWDWHKGECFKVLNAHSAGLVAVACSPVRVSEAVATQGASAFSVSEAGGQRPTGVGQLLASASQDGTIKLWCLNSGECYKSLKGQIGYSGTLVFRQDSRILASSGENGTITLWDVEKIGNRMHCQVGQNPEHVSAEYLITLQVPRPYEGMNIAGVKGLTEATIKTLLTLGASKPYNV